MPTRNARRFGESENRGGSNLPLDCSFQSRDQFQSRGLEPFEYDKNGQKMKMSYFLAPEEIYDDPDVAREWATLALGAALRSGSGRRR